MPKIALLFITPNPEQVIAYCARRSSTNPNRPEYENLIRYLLEHQHWSPFEHAYASVEIEASRAITRQILRHRSFTFQERSLRYAEALAFEPIHPRRQADKNRQSSVDDLPPEVTLWFTRAKAEVEELAYKRYKEALAKGVARESARFLLPESVVTNLVMTGTIRSWIHYLDLRLKEDTQLEHQFIAKAIQHVLSPYLPTISKVLGWTG